MRRFLCAATAAVALAATAPAQLSGNYTIDPNGSGPSNYTTFASAISALGAGVTGPVVFRVAPTTFNEAIRLSPINGTSATNRVTFVGNGGTPTINAGNQQVGILVTAGVQFVTFDDFKIRGATGQGIHVQSTFQTPASDVTFDRFDIDMPATSSSSVNGILIDYARNITVQRTVTRGGGYSVRSQQMTNCVFDSVEVDGKGQATYLLAPFNTNDADNLFQNCFFHDCRTSGYGIYMDLSSYGNMLWHNTVIVTTSGAAAWMGSCCQWSRACSWRNNILVNLGTGQAAVFGETTSGQLERFDADYNCYYAPNATNNETIRTERNAFRGTLAGWKTYFQNNQSSIVQPGGGTIYDPNSIEGDPGLVSMASPYDIHLKAGSPLVDAGTTKYVAGTWISYPASATVATDFEGEARGTQVDIGADEIGVIIVGSGAKTPGSTHTLNLVTSAGDAGLAFQTASSLGTGPILVGQGRQLGLSPDAMMQASIAGNLPQVFANYSGFINATGRGGSRINIPPFAFLKGITIHNAFVVLSPGFPFNIKRVSKTYTFQID